jgi:acyl-CoA synthetase (AMP-forming)/AMP-acid ligase II
MWVGRISASGCKELTEDTAMDAKVANVCFANRLKEYGHRQALRFEEGPSLTYEALTARVDRFARTLGPDRQLLLLETDTSLESIVAYLAALAIRNPVILVSPDQGDANLEIATIFGASKRITSDGRIDRLQPSGRSDRLHPDLAVLLSTSGSTGSAKLVRLSCENIESNAKSISTYLELQPDDVGALTLPLHYSYGLSILNSHLFSGAAVCISGTPVTSPEIMQWFEDAGCTNISGVPYSYEIYERLGFLEHAPSRLRFMTAAGGRLPPNTVRRYAEHLQKRGAKFFVMYGQTEASPRISYLPPALASTHPDCIGIAVPGGELFLIDDAGTRIERNDTIGELTYRGPNVMMGYATVSSDLAKGRETDELRTGDLAEQTKEGLFRIVGRKNRFSKLSGFRVSHEDVERRLDLAGIPAIVTGNDAGLVVALTGGTDVDVASRAIMAFSNIKPAQLNVFPLQEVPRLASGKIDYRKLVQLAPTERGTPPGSVQEAFAKAFWPWQVKPSDSFLSLGGDSLTFVELTLALEGIVGALPRDWEGMTIDEITGTPIASRERAVLDPNVYIRAFAILLVVLHHLSRWGFNGGANVLMCMVGYNLARFQSRALFEGRVKDVGRQLLKNVGLYYVVLACWMVWDRTLRWPELLLASNVIASSREPFAFNAYWFVESYGHIILAVILVCSIPAARRWISERPLVWGVGALAAGIALVFLGRLTWTLPWNACAKIECAPTTEVSYWAPIGWCLYFANSRGTKIWVVALALASAALLGLYYPLYGELSTSVGMFAVVFCMLTWRVGLPLPRRIYAITSYVAANSYAIYLLHLVPLTIMGQYGIVLSKYGAPGELLEVAFGIGVPLAIAATFGGIAAKYRNSQVGTRDSQVRASVTPVI